MATAVQDPSESARLRRRDASGHARWDERGISLSRVGSEWLHSSTRSLVLIPFLRASLLAAIAVAAGLGIARAGEDAGPATLPIAGVVRDQQGRPIPAVWIEVEGHPNPRSSPPAWRTDVHGRFQIADVPRGPAKLLVTTGDFWSAQRLSPTGVWSTHATKVVETRAGVRDLVIVLDPGPQLLVRIVGYVPGEQVRGARVTWEEPGGTRDWRWTPIRDDGWTRFVALPADRKFELWAEAEVNQRHVRATGLKPGDAEQRIERHEVKDIAGKVRASQALLELKKEWQGSLEHFRVDVYAPAGQRGLASGLIVAQARVQSDGSFRVRGLPPGTYWVNAGTHAGEIIDVSKQVEAGTTDVVLDLDKRE